jgi:hypothetical protein
VKLKTCNSVHEKNYAISPMYCPFTTHIDVDAVGFGGLHLLSEEKSFWEYK